MTFNMSSDPSSRSARGLWFLLVAGLWLAACDPPPDPTTQVFVSDPLPRCVGGAETCDLQETAFDVSALSTVDFGDDPTAALEAATGVGWRAVDVPADSFFVDYNAVFGGEQTKSAAYLIERIERTGPGDTLVTIGSNDGFALWVNGAPVARSRFDAGQRHAHSDLVQARLEPGANVLLYKVVQNDGIWTLYRELHPVAATDSLARYAADESAFADLPLQTILPDTATTVPMRLPATWTADAPVYLFQWATLLGDATLGDPVRYTGRFPERLPLPDGFDGAAVLELEVREAGTERRITGEVYPIFRRSAADRMARDISGDPFEDPVGEARRRAVREIYHLDPDTIRTEYVPRHQSHALADLYRYVHDRERIARYPGPQIWAYRSPSDGTVQPFRVHLPGGGVGQTVLDDVPTFPVLFFLNHWTNPIFWRGRGHSPGWYNEFTARSTLHGVMTVVPHLRGVYNFRPVAVEDFTSIRAQLDRHFRVDSTSVGVIGASNHLGQLFDVMMQMERPFTLVASLGPAPDVELDRLQGKLDSLYTRHPNIEWFIRRGSDDEIVSAPLAQIVVHSLERAGYSVDYLEVPHSGHWDMSVNVIAEVFRLLSYDAPDGEAVSRLEPRR